MTTHEEEGHRGGFRGAVDELFGRGDRTDDRTDDHVEGERRGEHVRDDRDEGGRRDDAYVEDPSLDDATLVNEPGTQSQAQAQYSGDATQRQTYGDEVRGDVRGDTVAPEQVQRGGDPTAQGQFQHGGEVRGDTDLPAQSHYDDAQRGSVADVRDDTRVTERPSGYADEGRVPTTDPAVERASVDQTATAEHAPVDDYPRDAVSEPTRSDAAVSDAAAGQRHDTVAASAGAGAGADMAAAHQTDEDGNAALVTADRAESYSSRWNSVKGEFVDEPRRAVADADALVGELLDELQDLFKAQRSDIERGLDADETSTEDLRLALRRYRSFFDRLLSI